MGSRPPVDPQRLKASTSAVVAFNCQSYAYTLRLYSMAFFDAFATRNAPLSADHAHQPGHHFRTGLMGEHVDDAGRRIVPETWSVPSHRGAHRDKSSYTREPAYTLDHPSERGQGPAKVPFWRKRGHARRGSTSSWGQDAESQDVRLSDNSRPNASYGDEADQDTFDLYSALISYEERWYEFIGWETKGEWAFEEVPWPTWIAPSTPNDLHSSSPSIRRFLLASLDPELSRKDRIRTAFLRWHPDKFFGRYMEKIKEEDREMVKEGVYVVCRLLQELQEERSA